jgi:hypothetical protein
MVIFHSYVKVYQRFKGRLTAPTALPPGDGLLHGSHGHSLADEVGGWTRDTQRPHQPQVTDQPWVTGPGEKPMGKWRFNHDKWRFNQFNHEKWMIMVNGHAGQEPIYWRYRFHIFLASILGSWNSHWSHGIYKNPATVDGCEILHQLIDGLSPFFYRVLTIPGGARFLPSTGPQNLSEFTKNS